MSRYFVGIVFCLILSFAYPAFRMEATEGLRHRKIRKRDIRQKQKGALNFWFYTELERAYGLGTYGTLLRLYPFVAGTLTVLHLSFGWLASPAVVDLVLSALTALYLSVMILMTCIRRNRRLFGSAFVLWGMRETKDPVPKGKILTPISKKGNYVEIYSVFFDLILTALPLAFPAMMGWFEYLGF